MLSVIATPIGNLEDISYRAVESLRAADLIAAEDTRHSRILLDRYQISKPLVSYHQHNEAMRTVELIERLQSGATIALITDAGMPGVSDPGRRLIVACIEKNLPYTIIPGPSAVINALIGSGFPSEAFYFGGFLPVKSGQRERILTEAIARKETTLFFESPYRLVKSLAVLASIAPDRLVCVARELTKHFEEYRRGIPAELVAYYTQRPPKGEITVAISAPPCTKRKPPFSE